jgi:vacuolar-type H+-ATPase subunit D/Vma8
MKFVENEKPENKVDKKSQELIHEFQSHYEEVVRSHPEYAERRDEIFQGWIIQKIAGIQVSIYEIAESLNKLVGINDEDDTPF